MAAEVANSMLDYFSEICRLKETSSVIEPAVDRDQVVSINDESEKATEFLTSLGYNPCDHEKEDYTPNFNYKELENILTVNQMATINKRVDTLRRKPLGRKDVRSLFLEDSKPQENHKNHFSCLFPNEDFSDSFSKSFTSHPPYQIPEIAETELKLHAFKFRSPFRSPSPNKEFDKTRFSPFQNSSEKFLGPVLFPDKVNNSIALEKTLIEDLGRKDIKMLEALARIELMGVFDKFKVEFTRQKSRKKIKDREGVFGVNLQTLVERDRKKDDKIQVPQFFKELLQHMEETCLHEEGILRLSGSFTRIKEIRSEIDSSWYSSCPQSSFSFKNLRPNDSSTLLKVFLRDLPSPLLTFEWIDAFIQIAKIPNVGMQIYTLSLLMLLLPEVNRRTLKQLLGFLNLVSNHSDKNLMTEESIAMIMAPNLFLCNPSSSSFSSSCSSFSSNMASVPLGSSSNNLSGSELDRDLQVATTTTNVILLMMKNQHEMFIVPAGLLNQIRQKNQENNKKMAKKKKARCDLNLGQSRKITVSVLLDPYCEEISFPLRPNTTVSDLVLSVVSQSKSAENFKTNEELLNHYSLYETGGNIEKRRLEQKTKLINILQVNPNAKFRIQKKSSPSSNSSSSQSSSSFYN